MTAEMKPSEIKWAGNIPSSWNSGHIDFFTNSRSGGTPDRDNPLFWDNGTIPWMASGEVNKSYVYETEEKITELAVKNSNAKMIKANSVMVALNGQGKTKGMSAILKIDSTCNQSLCAFTCNENLLNYEYLYYCFQTMYQHLRMMSGDSVRDGLAASFVKKQNIPLPSIVEQQSIAKYLDVWCSEIDIIIANMVKQVEILQQYKKSLITETVTKGLDASALMKDSRIEWIGQIPASWDEKRLQVVSYIRARLGWKGLTADEYVDEGYAFLSAFNVIDDMLDLSELNYINQFRYDESPEIKLHPGDIILVKDGAGLGKCARIDTLPFEATANGSLAVITTGDSLEYRYLYYYFVGDVFQQFIDRLKNGMGVPHLPQGYLRKIQVPIPPLHEQKAICDYLDEKCAVVNVLIAEKQKSIETVRQYKKSLIYEYVTGKKRVKEVQSCQ